MKNWMKRGIVGILCLNLIFGSMAMVPFSAYAVENTTAAETEKKEEKEPERPTHDKDGKPILSEGAVGILIDGKTGRVLYESGSNKKMYPASTTKVMTALLALEAVEAKKVSLDQKITIKKEMLKGLDPDGTNMALKDGEVIKFQDLLYGLMIPSGNDAAMAIAYTVGGSQKQFVDMMNKRAKELGLTKTKFNNPHGLSDKKHYTTAAEMAIIAYHAMQKQAFREIVEIAHIKIPPTNKTEEERYYINTNGLVSTMRYTQYYYQGATGIKTGYTDDAGNCLVSSAQRGGVELIAVLFHANGVDKSHKDSARMLDYGFSEFELMTPVKGDQILSEVKVKWGKSRESVTVSAVEPISVLVPKGTKPDELTIETELPEFIKAPVEKDILVGKGIILLNGTVVGEGQLRADLDVSRSAFWPIYAFFEWLWSFLVIRVLCYLVLAAAGIFVVMFLVRGQKEWAKLRRKKSRRRK